jgi:hypothetical protein
MANKYMNKCSTFLTTREIQIKIMLRFHFTHMWEEKEILYTVGGDVN